MLCEEALPAACGRYVEAALGVEFVAPPPWTLTDIFPATTARAPIIFILSAGADPTSELQRFAEGAGRVAGRFHVKKVWLQLSKGQLCIFFQVQSGEDILIIFSM